MVTSAVQPAQPYVAYNSIICMHYVLSVNSERAVLKHIQKSYIKVYFIALKMCLRYNSIVYLKCGGQRQAAEIN